MGLVNDIKHHPKYIWYFIKGEKTWYLPYFSYLPVRLKKNVWQFTINETELIDVDLTRSLSMLFYGSNERTGSLPIEFLKECAASNTSIIIHQNHISQPLVFYPALQADKDDLLTQQILHRENEKKRAYIARTLVKWQWHGRAWLCPTLTPLSKLLEKRNAKEIMQLEAVEASNYWSIYYRKLDLKEYNRRTDHIVNTALDSLSHFLSGLTLRWVLFHGLSPSHGFLHRSTNYSSLVYDLMEATRHWTEQAVFQSYIETGSDNLIENATNRFKSMLESPISSEPTRQNVYRRTLINGGVIALRYYLSGRMKHFLPPVEQTAKARGRKRQCAYTLPGQIWKQ